MDVATIPERFVRLIPQLELISVFEGVHDGGGWVSPGVQGLEINFGGSDTRMKAAKENLRDTYRFTSFEANELDHVLRTFVRMLSRARHHEIDGSASEAALHLVIALDLLFGEKGSSTQTVTTRAAAAAATELDRSLPDCVRGLQKVYGARSRYVHRGQAFPEQEAELADGVCSAVLRVLLRLHRRQTEIGTPISIANWIRALDYITAASNAGVIVPPDYEDEWCLAPRSS